MNDPIRPPTRGGIDTTATQQAEVTTLNGDGTVNVRMVSTRGARQCVPVVAGGTPAIGDRVLLLHLSGDPQSPVAIAPGVGPTGLTGATGGTGPTGATGPAGPPGLGPFTTAACAAITASNESLVTHTHSQGLTAQQITDAVIAGHLIDGFFSSLASWRVSSITANTIVVNFGNGSSRSDVQAALKYRILTSA